MVDLGFRAKAFAGQVKFTLGLRVEGSKGVSEIRGTFLVSVIIRGPYQLGVYVGVFPQSVVPL